MRYESVAKCASVGQQGGSTVASRFRPAGMSSGSRISGPWPKCHIPCCWRRRVSILKIVTAIYFCTQSTLLRQIARRKFQAFLSALRWRSPGQPDRQRIEKSFDSFYRLWREKFLTSLLTHVIFLFGICHRTETKSPDFSPYSWRPKRLTDYSLEDDCYLHASRAV
jgi:hypothetical protein